MSEDLWGPEMTAAAGWKVPADVVGRWIDAHGKVLVERWLGDVRGEAGGCEEEWQLDIEGFLPGGSLNCVLACRRTDGSGAVLKLFPPWGVEAFAWEALALAAWQGCGVVGLLECSRERRALLLSRVTPGWWFSPSGNDFADCDRVADTLRAVGTAPAVRGLRSLDRGLLGRFARAREALPCRREWVSVDALDAAEARAVELARSAGEVVAVHGDAQNKNLLVDGVSGALVAIDPEPAMGDRHFDPALWAVTHRPGAGVLERCAALAAALDLDESRLCSWCLVLAVAEVTLDVPERALAQRDLVRRYGSAFC